MSPHFEAAVCYTSLSHGFSTYKVVIMTKERMLILLASEENNTKRRRTFIDSSGCKWTTPI